MPAPGDTVGIMSDSHGRPALIEAAVRILRGRGCARLFHLGDICDSGMPETADECVRLLVAGGVLAVKGNNDHVLTVNFSGGREGPPLPETVEYLANLPPLLEYGDIAFTHSLPFFDTMGLSSLVRVMEEDRLEDLFARTRYRILFRGHGHTQELIGYDGARLQRFELHNGDGLRLEAASRYVITCGALVEGHGLIWDPGREMITGVKIL